MTDPEWRPGNDVEREMLTALEAGDGRRYAELLRGSPLYLPTVADGSEAGWPEGLPQMDDEHALVFTSPMTLFKALAGHAQGYAEYTFDQLRERWSDPASQLVINAGSPVGVFLTAQQVDDLADGTEQLTPIADVQDALVDNTIAEVRKLVLAELGTGPDIAARVESEVEQSELERKLELAVENTDYDAFLVELLRADVLVLTTEAVADPRRIRKRDFPWLILGGEESPIVPVFSSAELLDRIAPGSPHRVRVRFLDIVAAWPGHDYIMAFNPGTTTEFTMPAGGIPELTAAILESGTG